MTAKRLLATNGKDADQLKDGAWLPAFLETITMEGAASNLSDFHNEQQQIWKGIMDTECKIPTFPRILSLTTQVT